MTSVFSHPGKPLIDHLREVAYTCRRTMAERVWLLESPIPQVIMRDVSCLCGSFHDLGKATRYFQHYLLSENHEVLGPKNHALVSSLFVRHIVLHYLSQTHLSDFDQKLISTFAYTAVRRHHGGLQNLEDEVLLKEKREELNQIIEAFHDDAAQEIINYFLADLALDYDFQRFKNYIRSGSYVSDIYDFYDDEIKLGEYEDLDLLTKIKYFYLHQVLYSTLLLADKTDVIVDVKLESTGQFPNDGVEKYRSQKGFDVPKSALDVSKNKAYTEALDNLAKVFTPSAHIYSLTLPTGLGKTLTSLGVALRLRSLHPVLRRLVITIPFTSIIDQNYEVYQEVSGSADSSVILKHHHQAEPSYKLGEDELKPNVSQFLIETWQSEVVVTTFVQLLNSIFSHDKSLLMKLPNLANSVIILDEIQTISFKHWPLINQVFQELGKLLNCYFILMSATQPLIFVPGEEIREIVPDYKSYFGLFNRTRLINRAQESVSLANFVDDVVDYASEHPTRDILLILNTKASCLKVFESLKESVDTDACELYYMSTLITPFERKRIIELMKCKSAGKQRIVVTTQLIEAGVDISVDTVFRVLAPIDALIQAAGRANRYNEKGRVCEVFIYEIEESARGSKMVYGTDLLLKTQNVLKEITEIEESHYLQLIEAYFREIRKHSDSRINENLEYIEKLAFASLGQFSLIEERFTESLFVQLNEQAKRIWDQYCQIYCSKDTSVFEKRLAFGKIKSKFYDFTVNVPIPRGEKEIAFDSQPQLGFRLVELGRPSDFYAYSDTDFLQNTGYKEIKTIIF
jgi:CRISPR-associated endonuclease/helicase Cas3